jgi:hypothetical protein
LLPVDAPQLLIFLVFLVPGIVFQTVQGRFVGPSPDDQETYRRVLRALTVSTLFASLYAVALGGWFLAAVDRAATPTRRGGLLATPRATAFGALLLLFVVPAAVAALDGVRRARGWTPFGGAYDPTPRAWDFAFGGLGPCFVRVLTDDGRWIGGWFGLESFATGWPEPRELFVQSAYQMSAEGMFLRLVEGTTGIYIRCDDARLVEFVASSADTGDGTKGRARADEQE